MTLELTLDETSTISKCIDAIGTSDFPHLISQLSALISHADKVYLTALFEDSAPIALYGNHKREDQKELLDLYLDAAYLLDPFYLHFRKHKHDQVLKLDEIAPDDFKNSEYYSKFFAGMGLSDECAILLHFEGRAALFFSMGVEQPGKSPAIHRLTAAYPILISLARRHWTRLSPENPDGSGRIGAHLQAAFEAFGSSLLSPREGEIARMILQGHSSKAIALTFENSPETIKVHRKRIYSKIGVTGQGELLSVFLNALSKMPAATRGDPLQYL